MGLKGTAQTMIEDYDFQVITGNQGTWVRLSHERVRFSRIVASHSGRLCAVLGVPLQARNPRLAEAPTVASKETQSLSLQLETELQAELQITLSCACKDLASIWTYDGGIWNTGIQMVQQAVGFRPKLQLDTLPNREVLKHRQIPTDKAWRIQDVAT